MTWACTYMYAYCTGTQCSVRRSAWLLQQMDQQSCHHWQRQELKLGWGQKLITIGIINWLIKLCLHYFMRIHIERVRYLVRSGYKLYRICLNVEVRKCRNYDRAHSPWLICVLARGVTCVLARGDCHFIDVYWTEVRRCTCDCYKLGVLTAKWVRNYTGWIV